MTAPENSRALLRNRLLLAALWLVLYGTFALWQPPLLDDADSVHAEVAREMLLRHDWVTLYANAIRYLEKAPLFYWAMALAMKLFGATTAASRIPLFLAVGALTATMEALGRRIVDARAGWYAGVVTLTSFGIFIFSRINLPDVLVCFFLTAALLAYLRSEAQARPSRRLCWSFAAACALDVLTKGLIGIVFPLAIVAMHLLVTRGWRGAWARIQSVRPVTSLLLFATIAVPWHIFIALANPTQGHPGGVTFTGGHWAVPLPTDGNVHGWPWFYFVNEQLLRYLNLRVPRDYDTVPLWLFLGLILIWLMPWSAFLPAALQRALPWRDAAFHQRLRTHRTTTGERINLLLLLWAALPLLFFCFSTRQEYYVLPALPPLILLIARLLAEGEAAPTLLRRSVLALVSLGALAGVAALALVIHTRANAASTDLAALLEQNPGDYALSFGHFLDLNAAALGMFRIPLLLVVAAFGLCLPLGWLALKKKQPKRALQLTTLASVVFVVAAWRGLVIFSPALTSAQLAGAMREQLRPGDLVVIHGEYEAGSTLGFYLRRDDLHLVEGRSSNLWYGSFFTDAPSIFETRASIAAKWPGPRRIFLWEDPHDRERPPLALPAPVFVIAESGGKHILSNRLR